MKKILILLTIAVLAISFSASSQNVQRTEDGNFIDLPGKITSSKSDSISGYIYTSSKDVVYPVYRGPQGGFYIWRVSKKTGKRYKKYLKVDSNNTPVDFSAVVPRE
jgi:hypothetical protein